MAEPKINSEKTTKAADNEDKRLKMPESTDNVLIKSPYIITLVSCLLVISAEQDFSLTDDSDNVKFQYIKHPDSFRACVVQVSERIREVFNTAHNNMECIRQKSENIVTNVEDAIKLIKKGKNTEGYFRDAERDCAECIETAASITEEFEEVAMTMDELLEALIRSMGKYKNEQKAINLEMMKTTRERQQMKEGGRKGEMELACRRNLNDVKNAKEKYEEAVNSFPSPWKIKVMKFFDSAVDFFSSREVSTRETVKPSTTPKISNEEANAYLAAGDILNHANMLMSTSCGKNDITKVKILLEEICSDLNVDASQSVVRTVKELCEDGIEICNEINKEIDQAKHRSAATDARVEKFFERAKDFYNKAEFNLQNLERPEPIDENESGQKSGRFTKMLLKSYNENERKAREKLLKGYESYENSYDKMVQATKELEKILDDMVKFDHQSLDLSKICDVVYSSMETLNEIKEHWESFHLMIKQMYNIIKERLVKKMTLASTTKKQREESNKKRMQQMVIEESMAVQRFAHVVGGTSSFYCRVSKEYLLDGVARLQSVISLDPIKDRDKMVEIQKELQNAQQRMKDEVLAIAEEKREDLREKVCSTLSN